MGTFATGALANFQEAARRVGINKDRIQDILENAPQTDGVEWDDGTANATATLTSYIRQAFYERGLYQEHADRFIAAITALDTGITGNVTVPTYSTGGSGDGGALTQVEFEAALDAVGLIGDGTSAGTGTLGAVLSATPDESVAAELGDTVAYSYNDPA